MTALVTDAIVLHAFDYLESSRILKLLTREAGVRSVLARGARKSRRRFSAALDLYAQGTAELQVKVGRELDTLSAFDVTRSRPGLATRLERFTGASAIAELTLRFSQGADAGLFDAVVDSLDEIAGAPADRVRDVTLGAAWRVLAELGVAPTIDSCAQCHAPIEREATVTFSHPVGGSLCSRCGHLARGGRTLPASARDAIRAWLSAEPYPIHDAQEARAHQRLLREFLKEHLADDRPMRAFDVWERETLTPPTAVTNESAS
jgi:DNA repair protein RecO (recombination protein O)